VEIKVNKDTVHITSTTNVLSLLQQLRGEKLNGLAVAVNETVIPRPQWEIMQLNQNDNVLIIQATQGG
jgi:sulfur carrier protein